MESKSILYVLPPELPIDYEAVGAVQAVALEKKLPFAVVYQLRERGEAFGKHVTSLHGAEKTLAASRVPLILLLGPSEVILESLIRHAGAEVHDLSSAQSRRPIIKHPYAWPGMVRSIDELQPLIDQMTSSENRTFC